MAQVRYFVTDVDQSVAFFERLGFVVVERWGPAFAIVSRDGLELWLSGPRTSAARPMPDGSVPTPGGWNRIALSLPALAEFAEELRSAGVAFRSELISGPGGTQVLIEDPDGNPIELFQAR